MDLTSLEAKSATFKYPSLQKASPSLYFCWQSNLLESRERSSSDTLIEEASVLEDISFSLKPGDRLAVTEPNGSGKTTLLRILAGGIPLTSGSIEHHGHLVSLINPRAGINPEAKGYENVFLRGLYLNQSVRHMREIVPQIIELNELGDAIYKPARAYSSGMRAGLAFSIMVHSNPDIVVID